MSSPTAAQETRPHGWRLAATGLLALALAASAAAQPLHRFHDGRGRGAPAPEALADYLGLDETQAAALKDLLAGLAEEARPIREQQRALRDRLDETLAAGSPDPAIVGALIVELRDTREKLRAARSTAIDGFAARLTPAQAEKLAALRQWKEARRGHGRHR